MSEFPNCEIKLCDLEVSRVIQDSEQIREIIGTPDYVGETISFLNYRAIPCTVGTSDFDAQMSGIKI